MSLSILVAFIEVATIGAEANGTQINCQFHLFCGRISVSMISLWRNFREDCIREDELQMECSSRTKIDPYSPLEAGIAFNLTPGATRTILAIFTALECDSIGIWLAVKDPGQWSVAILNAIDATGDMRPDWLKWPRLAEPHFFGFCVQTLFFRPPPEGQNSKLPLSEQP